jgi:hypothetical protein
MARREEMAIVAAMESKIGRVAAMLAGGWKNGERVIAGRVAADRTAAVADRTAAIRTSPSRMEGELRNVAAQPKIVMAGS